MKKILKLFILILLLNVVNYSFADEDYSAQKSQIIALYNSNSLQDAYQMIAKIPEDKRDAEMWLILANITQDYKDDLDAFFLLQKAIEKDPKYYKAYYNLATLYFKDNRTAKAIENYELAIKYNKDFAYAYYNLGCCYFKLGEFQKAKSYMAKAIRLNSREPNFYYNLALTYKKLHNEKQAKKALDYYNNLQKVI